MYSGRLFAFGCSFTNYVWPTWADLLGQEFESYYNYGRPGAGNLFITVMLGEALARFNINHDDTVMIMWSNVTREDRYVDKWLNPGNIFTQNDYSEEFVKKYITVKGCYIRDLGLVQVTRTLLDNIGCKYHFMSMIDMTSYHQWEYNDDSKQMKEIFKVYQNTLDICKPSVFKVLFNYDWYKGKPIWPNERKRKDIHPLPLEHIEYINKVLPEYKFSDKTIEVATIEHNNIKRDYEHADMYPMNPWWANEFKNKNLMQSF